MAKVPLSKLIKFYVRFTPSYSAIGYNLRSLLWRNRPNRFSGQTWLITGGSEGIGASAARQAAEAGARVICVARDARKLEAFAQSVNSSIPITWLTADFSKTRDVHRLIEDIRATGHSLDVLVNNVGIQKHQLMLTDEEMETSFVTNILSHHILVKNLLESRILSDSATVIEVASGGMYNHKMVLTDLNIAEPARYIGPRAYGLAKRAQCMTMSFWRERSVHSQQRFYAMHPGWVDTASVNRSMPRFVAILKSVLRDHDKGADTIVYLARERPDQKRSEAIWFDRKERSTHIYAHTPNPEVSASDVVNYLDTLAATQRA
ncbi:SDR family NAD(P)-dependent oxidoreductase [Comamonas testosteroni]|uniref:SDR family NAD(P)-dependent oxidoreductase n=1 Tax=Comamonas testosteroni TaxID=285 RepID=UPI0005B4FDE8|nr:SDR family NAD(P)-dependent oxidoreductase [Comamonas testosteroni]